MKMRTLAGSLRLAGRTARIGTVRSNGVSWRTTAPSLSSAAKSHAGAWAIPICSRKPTRIYSRPLVRNTPVGITHGFRPTLSSTAARTAKALSPAEIRQILPAMRLGRKSGLQLHQIAGIIFHAPEHYRLGLRESCKYPSCSIYRGASAQSRAIRQRAFGCFFSQHGTASMPPPIH